MTRAAGCSIRALVPRAPLVGYGLLKVERKHPPKPPHWYLATVGTEPSAQGRGLGTAVLKPVLDQCDHDDIGAYLESSKERNVDYYARLGFRVTEEVRLPRGPRLADVARSGLRRASSGRGTGRRS